MDEKPVSKVYSLSDVKIEIEALRKERVVLEKIIKRVKQHIAAHSK
jgi:hypothetical protein